MFFDKDGFFRLDELVAESASFQKIMADQIVTDEEVAEQAAQVLQLYRELENEFPPEQLRKIADVIVQTGVLYAISKHKELQDFHY